MLTFVTATRLSDEAFWAHSPLARSLKAVAGLMPLRLQVAAQNTQPLAEVYNSAIRASGPNEILVFVHDDVAIDDWMAGARLREALGHYDVVGVAGNRRRQPGQQTWYMKPGPLVDGRYHITERDSEWLSGAVRHGEPDENSFSAYGPAPAAVALLDGVLLAARGEVLKARGVWFDPQFSFHFYDLDFCRSAEQAGLRMGTWPLALTHTSKGASVMTDAWAQTCLLYLRKWGELAQSGGSDGHRIYGGLN